MTTAPITNIDPDLLAQWLDDANTRLIDVREDHEFAEERIPGAIHAPLSRLDPAALRAAHPNARLIFQCRSGRRSLDAATRCRHADEPAYHLAGGIEAWKAANRPTIKPASAPRIPIMRQVQIVAGALVVLGVALSWFASPWFLILPAFVGSGLVFAGLSGWCGMATLLAAMPWNHAKAAA